MKSIAFFNNKGGVGKTTLLCNVAACLAIIHDKKVCVVDADPQCNATQYFFSDTTINRIYENSDSFTIQKVIEPLSYGEGYSEKLSVERCQAFHLDVVPGDPRLALTEDLLARDWGDAKSGDIRGIRTNLVFSELLSRLHQYDFVLFDVSPSLGALNRSILLSTDYFVSPMSIDIFSLKAFENIATWIQDWTGSWKHGISVCKHQDRLPNLPYGDAKFLGYVTQQYLAKRDASGKRRAVQAYEKIRKKIDAVISKNELDQNLSDGEFQIGTVPNLFSLIPMSQSSHKPVFELVSSDGVVGAHFGKVKEARSIFNNVTRELLSRVEYG